MAKFEFKNIKYINFFLIFFIVVIIICFTLTILLNISFNQLASLKNDETIFTIFSEKIKLVIHYKEDLIKTKEDVFTNAATNAVKKSGCNFCWLTSAIANESSSKFNNFSLTPSYLPKPIGIASKFYKEVIDLITFRANENNSPLYVCINKLINEQEERDFLFNTIKNRIIDSSFIYNCKTIDPQDIVDVILRNNEASTITDFLKKNEGRFGPYDQLSITDIKRIAQEEICVRCFNVVPTHYKP